jgi:dihydropteroate synthase
MSAKIYLRPTGLVHGSEAREFIRQGKALSLAGGFSAFSACEVIRRDGRQILSIDELTKTAEFAEKLQLITSSRPDFAGLSMKSPQVMGVINVTPDSFSDGGVAAQHEAAIEQGRRLAQEGASILDVGGESTRPGSDLVPAGEELQRINPVIQQLAQEGYVVSVDSRKPEVMEEASQRGARILNDVSALSFSPQSPATAARLDLPIVLMHAQGDPKTMQDNPVYEDVALDVFDALEGHIEVAMKAGVPRAHLMVDPGIGFGKTFKHNLELMQQLSLFHGLGVPILLGASRKAFIGAITGERLAAQRMPGSVGMAMAAALQGAQVIRVHDVRESVHSLKSLMAAHDAEATNF